MLFRVLLLSFLWVSVANSAIVDPSRVITWQGNAGVSLRGSGIPARTTEHDCTASPYNVPTNGTSDCKTALQACLNGIPAGETAKLPAGTFQFSSGLTVPAGKTLRGAGSSGASKTLLNANGAATQFIFVAGSLSAWNGFGVYANYCPEVNAPSYFYPLTGTPAKGDTTITVSDASSISIGDYGIVNQVNNENSSAVPWVTLQERTEGAPGDPFGYGHCTKYDDMSKARSHGQVVKVTGKSNNTLTIEPPLMDGYANSPAFSRIPAASMASGAGIENLAIDNPTHASISYLIRFEVASNNWVTGCDITNFSIAGIRFAYGCLFNEVFKTVIHDGISSASNAYSVLNEYYTTGNLIHNNVFDNVVSGTMFGSSASGNVWSYNYFVRMKYTGSWLGAATAQHANHAFMNLGEGNVVTKALGDLIHGSNSNAVFFRNHMRLNGLPNDGVTKTGGVRLEFQRSNRYVSFIGNILGYSGFTGVYQYDDTACADSAALFYLGFAGTTCSTTNYDTGVKNTIYRHGNYAYCSGASPCGAQTWDEGNADHTLPNSLYLTGKPGWFGTLTWPPIDPATQTVADIPAKVFYDTGSWPDTNKRTLFRH